MNPRFWRSAASLVSPSPQHRRALLTSLLPKHLGRYSSTLAQADDARYPSDSEEGLDLDAPLDCPAGSLGPLDFPADEELGVAFRDWDEEKGSAGSSKQRGEEMEISRLFISPEIVSRLEARGITKLFPIQRAVLGPALQGRDMICRARTGTGKTLAYGIPIMDKIIRYKANPGIKRRFGRKPLALVLTPTRELARQVEKEFRDSSSLKTLAFYGGDFDSSARKLNDLNYGIDVLVGTPGRINDLLSKNVLNLSQVQFVVFDESDEVLAVSLADTVEKIIAKLPRRHQTIMFSSTMPGWITEFQDVYLNNPLIIDIVGDSARKLPEEITLYSIASDNYIKPSVVVSLIAEHAKEGKCIVFARSKRDVNQLSDFIGQKFSCRPLHADIHQNDRNKALSDFCDGKFNVLAATDIAARGLDVPDVDLVIHYDMPVISENFVHRSGRTGRAGKKGKVVLIHTEEQTEDVRNIEQDVGCKFEELPRLAVDNGCQLMRSDLSYKKSSFYEGPRLHNKYFVRQTMNDLCRSDDRRPTLVQQSDECSNSRSSDLAAVDKFHLTKFEDRVTAGFKELNMGRHLSSSESGSKFPCRNPRLSFSDKVLSFLGSKGNHTESRLAGHQESYTESHVAEHQVNHGNYVESYLAGHQEGHSKSCSSGYVSTHQFSMSNVRDSVSECSDNASCSKFSNGSSEAGVSHATGFQDPISSSSAQSQVSTSGFGGFAHSSNSDSHYRGFHNVETSNLISSDDATPFSAADCYSSSFRNSPSRTGTYTGFGSFTSESCDMPISSRRKGLNDS